jgi:hypothetical protein
MSLHSLSDFAAQLFTAEADMKHAQEEIVVRGAKIIQKEAKGLLGKTHPQWAPLKPETIEHKIHGNTPLFETGEMRDSIEVTAPVRESLSTVAGYTGSNDMNAVYQELGTSRGIPPRSFLAQAALNKEGAIHRMAGRIVMRTLNFGGPAFRELKHVLHVFKRAGEQLKEAGENLGDFEDHD